MPLSSSVGNYLPQPWPCLPQSVCSAQMHRTVRPGTATRRRRAVSTDDQAVKGYSLLDQEEVLRRACKDGRTALGLTARWRTVFGQRGGAVHFSEVSGPTVPHSSGITNAAQVHVDYSQETANSAVDLLLETLMAVESTARPAMAEWVNDMAGALTEIRNKRN